MKQRMQRRAPVADDKEEHGASRGEELEVDLEDLRRGA